MSQTDGAPATKPGMSTGARIALGLAGAVGIVVGILQFSNGMKAFLPASGDAAIASAAKEAQTSADKFLAATKEVYKTGNPPRESDAETGPLLDKVFGTDVLRSKPITFEDRNAIMNWMLADVRTGSVYLLAGTGAPDPTKLPADPKVYEQIGKNVLAYAPEIGRYMDASVVLNGAVADLLTSQAAKPDENDKTKEGKRMMRSGITTSISGVLQTIPTEGLSDDWRRARLTVLNETAPKLAKALEPAQCTQLRDVSGKVAGATTDAGVKKGLEDFGAAVKC